MAQRRAQAAALLLAALKRDNEDLEEHPEYYLEAAAEMLAEELEADPKRARSLAYLLPRNQRIRRMLLRCASVLRPLHVYVCECPSCHTASCC